MLKRTFLHIPGVGPKRELAIWRAGIESWEDFLDRGEKLLPPQVYNLGRPVLKRSLRALESPGGLAELARALPVREHWRFWPHFSRVAYLDIETGGDLEEWGGVTVVGVYDGEQVEQYVSEHNMWLINDALKPYDVVCTFAGNSFDLPVLKRVFPKMYLPPVSIDLRWCLKRLGHTGGLKRIEKRLNLSRPETVADMDGFMAVRLWTAYQNGDAQALDTLLTYNAYDVINLKPLLEFSAKGLRELVLGRLPAKNV